MKSINNNIVDIINLGLVPYNSAWDFQKKIFNLRKSNIINDTVLFLEHPHTITMGKSAHLSNLLLNKEELESNKIHLEYIDRGGDITYHGPGQLVVYPIIDLNNYFKDLHKYLRILEDVVIDFLNEFNISAGKIDGLTGVWVNNEKICAIGVKVSRWITMHGIAININTDLSYFNHIIPCGISDKNVTSLKQIVGKELNMNEITPMLIKSFMKLFKFEIGSIKTEKLTENYVK